MRPGKPNRRQFLRNTLALTAGAAGGAQVSPCQEHGRHLKIPPASGITMEAIQEGVAYRPLNQMKPLKRQTT